MADLPNVLMIEDDPNHLKIYGWILQQAGVLPVPCLVDGAGVDLPKQDGIDLVILDYHPHCKLTPEEVARLICASYPDVPILLLSDVQGLPADVAPYVAQFVRKGEPRKLVSTILKLLQPPVQPAG
jgi:DNA-binding response OmpR family regulator